MSHRPQQHALAAYAAVAMAMSANPASNFFMVASGIGKPFLLYTRANPRPPASLAKLVASNALVPRSGEPLRQRGQVSCKASL